VVVVLVEQPLEQPLVPLVVWVFKLLYLEQQLIMLAVEVVLDTQAETQVAVQVVMAVEVQVELLPMALTELRELQTQVAVAEPQVVDRAEEFQELQAMAVLVS
jgi:hypothetical protein